MPASVVFMNPLLEYVTVAHCFVDERNMKQPIVRFQNKYKNNGGVYH